MPKCWKCGREFKEGERVRRSLIVCRDFRARGDSASTVWEHVECPQAEAEKAA